MKTRHYVTLFILGTIATYGLALLLLEKHHPLAAAELVWWSPFPCPPGIPC